MLNKTYFPGLNELRALAVLSIIPGHIEQFKQLLNLPYFYWFPIPGKLAVVLFFVLSGFLITILLLKEKLSTNKINLRNFYLKRMLRIWPLYFLIMALSIFLFNKISIFEIPIYSLLAYEKLDTTAIILILLIIPNYMAPIIPYAAHTWSIGIEEQFYLIQPFIIKVTKHVWLIILFMFLIIFLKEILNNFDLIKDLSIIKIVAPWSSYFGCIAIGSIGAILCHAYPKSVKNIIFNQLIQVVTLLILISFLIAIAVSNNEQIIDFRLHAVLFIIIVINAATNPSSSYNLNNKFLDYIGRISYGMYIYHGISIIIAIRIAEYFSKFFINSIVILNVFSYILTLIFTITISTLSYKYVEKWLLDFKQKLPT